MFVLSNDPIIQQIQLQELLERSYRCLQELTSPIDIMPENDLVSKDCSMYGKNLTCQDYVPPSTRFARIKRIDPSSNQYDF